MMGILHSFPQVEREESNHVIGVIMACHEEIAFMIMQSSAMFARALHVRL